MHIAHPADNPSDQHDQHGHDQDDPGLADPADRGGHGGGQDQDQGADLGPWDD